MSKFELWFAELRLRGHVRGVFVELLSEQERWMYAD